jgi:hypothetical protein
MKRDGTFFPLPFCAVFKRDFVFGTKDVAPPS